MENSELAYWKYYPLEEDIRDITGYSEQKQPDGDAICIDLQGNIVKAGEQQRIRLLCAENSLSSLQIKVLLLKDAFEGYLKIFKEDTLEWVTTNKNTFVVDENYICTDLATDFLNHVGIFRDGINKTYTELARNNDDFSGQEMCALVHSQLFRFPLTYLKDLKYSRQDNGETGIFATLNEMLTGEVRRQLVNDAYNLEFGDHTSLIRSKNNLLFYLQNKLNIASHPSVKDQDDLNEKYLDFLREFQGSSASANSSVQRFSNLEEGAYDRFEAKIKEFYKAIAFNCFELFVDDPADHEIRQVLNPVFIKATEIYRSSAGKNKALKLYACINLRHLLLHTAIIRTTNGMKSKTADPRLDGGLLQDYPALSSELDKEYRQALYVGFLEDTEMKIRALTDPDIRKYHLEDLKQQLLQKDEMINELERKIEMIIKQKKS